MQIRIVLADQTLTLLDDAGALVRRYPVSTAARGAGEQSGSFQTPRGRHLIRARIGAGQPAGTVFRARRPTGEICDAASYAANPDRDWILTRILWLSGCEPGRNRLGKVDTMRRYVYIHGTPDEVDIGKPGSHGCVRMRNHDLIDLFDRVPVGTPVEIIE
ncbi:L,D-transpeptidase [Microvirgula aerodenitrificans]|uniref:L,D-transpeptidase n=1 Tax=Microvirgula aerodenitrificans TaxID=57480 RepID=UPI00248E2D9C|nr:L,D-transpeptidase [Microvirgula aerodenitrificans]